MDIRRLQLNTSRYHLTIQQSGLHCAIDIRPASADTILGGYITALKQLDMVSLEIQPAEVVFYARFSQRKPEQIEPLCDWLMIVADLAKQLDFLFVNREDFGVLIAVKEVGNCLVVGKAEMVEVQV